MTNLRAFALVWLLLCLGCGPGAHDVADGDGEPTASVGSPSLEQRLEEMIAAAEVPGLALATVAPDGTIDEVVVGVASLESGAPVTTETVFEAASLSKPVTAYGALVQVAAGRLDLDRPLAEIVDVVAFADGLEDPRLLEITPWHVLSHTSGFPNWRRDGPPELRFDPGSEFGYSGEGFVLLGRALETLSGQPLDEYLASTVLEPLGMTRSSFVWRAAYVETSAVGHDLLGVAREKGKPPNANAAASLHTTAGDYALFLREMLRPTLVPEDLVARMAASAITIDDGIGWSLGWGVETVTWERSEGSLEDSGVLWHWGDNGAFRCFTALSPVRGEAVVYLTNSENGLALAATALHDVLGPAEHPAVEWAGYPQVADPAFRAQQDLLRAGVEGGAEAVRQTDAVLRAELPEVADDEALYNSLGYSLLWRDTYDAAIAIFSLNVERHPESANVHDSLGEGYLRRAEAAQPEERADDVAQAVAAYERSLELDSGNDNARAMLERLAAL
ncbi:MAG: serine hydrolase domain-containing protein [Acidobacteriota bacterium]